MTPIKTASAPQILQTDILSCLRGNLFLSIGEYTSLMLCNISFGSLAELNDTPKAAVRAAGIEGMADLAIGGSGFEACQESLVVVVATFEFEIQSGRCQLLPVGIIEIRRQRGGCGSHLCSCNATTTGYKNLTADFAAG